MIIEKCSKCGKKFEEKMELIVWSSPLMGYPNPQILCEKCSKFYLNKDKKEDK